MATAREELTRAKFSSLDFDTVLDDLLARAQAKFSSDFNDFALSQLGIVLLDLVAYALDNLSFYLDRRATDTFLATVRTRKSFARLARPLGYKIGAAVAASVDLRIALTQTYAFDVPINQGFQFRGPNGLIFEAARLTTFLAGSGPSDFQIVPVFEGQTITESFVSDGSANQLFALRRVPDGKFVVLGTVRVIVNGVPFEESEFLTYNATDQFEVGYAEDPPAIHFGDGSAGNIPATGASIDVTYVASSGEAGKVSSAEITAVVAPLVVAFTTIPLTITNPEASIGGDGIEDLERVRAFAGRVFKARQVGITEGDYQALAGSYADPLFGRVAVAKALAPRSAAGDLALQNYLLAITDAVSDFLPAVTAATDDATTRLATMATLLTSLGSSLSDIAAAVTDADGDVSSAITNARTVKNKALEIATDATDIANSVTAGKAAVDAIATDDINPSRLSTANKNTIKGFFDLIGAEATNQGLSAATIQSTVDTEVSTLGDVRDTLESIGLTTATGLLLEADTTRASLETERVALVADLDAIDEAITDQSSAVSAAVASINSHVDGILSADCQANLVVVPILGRNKAGFYAAPSVSLIQSLQAFLDARKEVTHTVEVTSGASFLVPAVLTVRLGVRSGFSESLTRVSVEAVIDGVLRDRAFGADLYVSDLVCAAREVEGVFFVNITIDGHDDGMSVSTLKLDAEGNLIIDETEVITKGTVTVTTETVTA